MVCLKQQIRLFSLEEVQFKLKSHLQEETLAIAGWDHTTPFPPMSQADQD